MSIFGKRQLPPESGMERGTYSGNMFAGWEEPSQDSLSDLKYAARAKGGHVEASDGKLHVYVEGRWMASVDECVGGVEQAIHFLKQL